jgi:hypothetical protein
VVELPNWVVRGVLGARIMPFSLWGFLKSAVIDGGIMNAGTALLAWQGTRASPPASDASDAILRL